MTTNARTSRTSALFCFPLYPLVFSQCLECDDSLVPGTRKGELPSKENVPNTPLFVAVFNSRSRPGMIDLLRSRGADPLHENLSGQTPMGLAGLIGNYVVAQYFKHVR